MAKSFAITTTATEALRADARGHAEASFTVTNTRSRPIRGLAQVKPLGDTKREWLSIQGETERDFAAGATQQFTVSFNGPRLDSAGATPAGSPAAGATATTAAARKYPFRLDVASALNPDEDFTEGPTVNVEMQAPPAAAPKGKFPLWILFVILGVVLLIIIIVLILVFKGGDNGSDGDESPTPTPVASATATSTPPPSQAEIEQACFDLVQEKIAWNYSGMKHWFDLSQIRTLCRGTANSGEPPACFQRVMHGGINWGGGIQWEWPEALALCAGTNDSNATISCFQTKISEGIPKAAAIEKCRRTGM